MKATLLLPLLMLAGTPGYGQTIGHWTFDRSDTSLLESPAVGVPRRLGERPARYSDEVPGAFLYDPLTRQSRPNRASAVFSSDDRYLFFVSDRDFNPVYSATLVGPPPMEDCYLAKATERLFLPMLQAVMPEIRDYWLPWEGVFHNIVIVSIDKEFPGHAYKLINGLWGQGQMSFCKAIVVVDKGVNPQDGAAVARRLLTHLDIETDIVVTKGVLDVLDRDGEHHVEVYIE